MSDMEFLVGPLAADYAEQLIRVDSDSFNFALDRARAYYAQAEPQNFRAVRVGREIAACLASIPCGQFFGGRSVPMAAIAAVGVGVEHRGRGVGAFLMRGELDRLHAAGVALSTLYPATVPLYRNAGYELAGIQFRSRLDVASIDLREHGLTLRRDTPDDAPRIEALYREMAAENNGAIDRSPFFWQRVRVWRGDSAQGFVVEGPAGIEGYAFCLKRPFDQPPSRPGYYTLDLTDVVARTAAAARRLLTFLADHFSQADIVRWYGPAADPLSLYLREGAAIHPSLRSFWMLRIVSAQAAIETRGYAPGVKGELHLEIRDDLLPGNAGKRVLEVCDGRGMLRAGGRGDVRIDIRGLAALYTGYYTPHELRQCGYLDASDEDAATAALLFSGPQPWMRDSF